MVPGEDGLLILPRLFLVGGALRRGVGGRSLRGVSGVRYAVGTFQMLGRKTAVQDVIAWVDVETTGLNPWEGESLLEVACLVTDTELNLLDEEGFEAYVPHTYQDMKTVSRNASQFVREMHEKNGLWDKLVLGDGEVDGFPLAELDARLLEYVRGFAPEARTARLGGNSVRLDLNFLEKYLPETYGHLHYRFIDVTSVSSLVYWWGGVPKFEKRGNHTAMSDIRESIDELRYMREQGFRH